MCTPGTEFVEIAQAALRLETTEMRVLMMLKKNELQGKIEEGVWYVDKASLNLCAKPQAADVVRKGGCGGGCGSGNSSGCGGH